MSLHPDNLMFWEEIVECVLCLRQSESRVCGRCMGKLNSYLADVQVFRQAAGGNLVPSSGTDRRGSERGLGVRLDALDFVAGLDILPTLEDWERDWRSFFGLTAFGPASLERMRAQQSDCDPIAVRLGGCIRFLQQNLQQACDKHPAIEDFASELHGAWRQAQAAADAQPRTSWRVTCPADTDDGECGRQIRISGEDFDGTVVCRACSTSWPVERLLRVVASSQQADLWLDPEAASRWFGIPARELRRWAQSGRVRRANGRYELHSIRATISEGVGA